MRYRTRPAGRRALRAPWAKRRLEVELFGEAGVLLDVLEAEFGLLAHEPLILTLALAVAAAAQSEPFEMADTNTDGMLTQEEISAFFGADLVSRILDAEDANGDGVLTRAEAEHALAEGANWREYEGPEVPDD
jgi:hypothetical protein